MAMMEASLPPNEASLDEIFGCGLVSQDHCGAAFCLQGYNINEINYIMK
jgi:hypothetical protein